MVVKVANMVGLEDLEVIKAVPRHSKLVGTVAMAVDLAEITTTAIVAAVVAAGVATMDISRPTQLR